MSFVVVVVVRFYLFVLFIIWFMVLVIDLIPPNVELVSVNDYIAKRRVLYGADLHLLLFSRVVRLSTVVYLALKLTWALVHWFVTFSIYSLKVSSLVVWHRRELSLGGQPSFLLTIIGGCLWLQDHRHSWSLWVGQQVHLGYRKGQQSYVIPLEGTGRKVYEFGITTRVCFLCLGPHTVGLPCCI